MERNYDCFIIAEAGVNHNGSTRIAKKLIDSAKEAGADAIKFQTYKSEDLVTADSPTAPYQQRNTGKIQNQFNLLKSLELSTESYHELKQYCDKKSIVFLSTPHTESSLNILEELIPIYKIGSGDLTNLPFIDKIAKLQKPIIMSTGMGSFKEIELAINTIRKHHDRIVVLHCTTNYPCPLDQVNLLVMLEIQRKFGVLVGYSDHTEGIDVALMAASLGAVVIEKHFTIDRNMQGPDHRASLEPNELKDMITKIRKNTVIDIPKMVLGTREKTILDTELDNKKIVRKSVIARSSIKAGTILTDDLLIVKRPGTGIAPELIKDLIGKRAKRHIVKDELLKWDDVE